VSQRLCRRNQRRLLDAVERFGRGDPAEHPSGAVVEFGRDSVELVLGEPAQVSVFVQILAQQPLVFSLVPRCQGWLELLEEIGYTRLTIPLVAARAGSNPPAVYRRFPTKIELVYEAVFPNLPSAESLLADDLESGVRALIRASIALFSRPAVHTAI
jgi:hypothetical protein